MAVLVISTSSDAEVPHYTQATDFDGREFILDFRWNQRNGFWYLDISSEDGVSLAAGLLVSVNWFLTKGLVEETMPPGEFLVVDSNTEPTDPGLTDLGSRLAMLYLDAEEMAAIRD